ncbi:coiled-coil domain-containing protein 106-like, partial [Morone saxatilis]|uniref:coiled-coil domain-containing protein 106-like n=1 Tax=Morone saxatilis TaxID=34816 RepID=UPI0015E21AF5
MAKLKEDYRLLKEENRLLKEENRLLKEERGFLRQKGLNPVKTRPSTSSKVQQGPEDAVHRYRAVLKEFRRTRSISLSCESLSVDRNTIALTAIIAEVWIAAEGEDFGLLPEFTEEDTVGKYAKTCKTFLE